MREYQKLQQMEVAKVDASGGSESASGTEESEAVEPDLYYYHTDHLGSTSIITDRNGDIAQYLAYIPYGETFIEERNVASYKFNGKELDQETGYYYYGARYYDPQTALWFGTDPLAHKYPMNSPYVYCNGNPIKYVDPDGRWPWENRNIRDARAFASQNGFEVQLIDGKYGKDAVVVKDGNVVTTYSAILSGQKTWYDNLNDHHNDCANLGTTTTSDVRAVADYCEVVSDVCDATAVGLAVTGVGLPAAGALARAGTVAGTVSDGINIGVDLYEGKNFKAGVRIIGNLVSYNMSRITKTNNPRFEIVKNIFFDEIVNYIANKIVEKFNE